MFIVRSHDDFVEKLDGMFDGKFKVVKGQWENQHSILRYKCNECGFEFDRACKSIIRKKDNPDPCKQCRKETLREKNYLYLVEAIRDTDIVLVSGFEEYINDETNNMIFNCLRCGKDFKTCSRDIHRYEMTQCGFCTNSDSNLTSEEDIADYIERHSESKLINGQRENQWSPVTIECDCGRQFKTRLNTLKNKRKFRCDVCTKKMSTAEYVTLQFLEKYDIPHVNEYTPAELGRLRFDFAIFEHGEVVVLIELDGKQHYKPIPIWGGEERFILQQENDKRKTEYCKKKGIPLIRIPYFDFNRIDEILLEELSMVFTGGRAVVPLG